LGASAEDDCADGSSGFGIGNRNVAAAGFFLDGHLRDERDTHARADHAEQTGELTAFEDDLRMDARAVARGEGVFAKAVAIPQEKERFRANVFQRDGAPICELVFPGQDREERFGEERERFEFVAANGKGENGDIDGAGAKTIEKHGSDFFDDGKLSLRELF